MQLRGLLPPNARDGVMDLFGGFKVTTPPFKSLIGIFSGRGFDASGTGAGERFSSWIISELLSIMGSSLCKKLPVLSLPRSFVESVDCWNFVGDCCMSPLAQRLADEMAGIV